MPHQCTSCGYLFEDGSKEMLQGCPDCGGNTFQFHPKGSPIPEVPTDEPPEPEGGAVGETVGRATNKVRGMFGGGPAGAPGDRERDGPGPSPEEPPSGEHTSAETSSDEVPGTTDETAPDKGGPEFGHDAEVERTTPPRAREEPRDDDDDLIDADAREGNTPEDAAQASARTEFVTAEELPPKPQPEAGEAPDTRPNPTDGRVVREPTGRRPSIEELREELNDQFESIKIVDRGQYELNLMELYNREEYVIALQENGRYVIQMPENWLRDRQSE